VQKDFESVGSKAECEERFWKGLKDIWVEEEIWTQICCVWRDITESLREKGTGKCTESSGMQNDSVRDMNQQKRLQEIVSM
jgi:hypothetical protein